MKHIILAAGRGSRLRPLTDNNHKTMLKINDKPIIKHMVDNILYYDKNANFIVVLGYKGCDIKEYLYQLNLNITFIENPIWDKTNNIYSLYLALNSIEREPFILLDSDIFFSKGILKQLYEVENNTFLIRKGDISQEDMKVVIEGGKIVEISKEIPVEKANGESIGIEYFNKKSIHFLKQEIEYVMENIPNGKNLFYEYAFQNLIKTQKIEINPIFIDEYAIEIDTFNDFQLAKKLLNE